MTQEEKDLLLCDLCTRLPYGVKVEVNFTEGKKVKDLSGYAYIINQDICVGCSWMPISDNIKIYLRPMSSMTKEEKREYNNLCDAVPTSHYEFGDIVEDIELYDNFASIDWLNAHYFDYRGLIPKGLALEAPEGMYNTKE